MNPTQCISGITKAAALAMAVLLAAPGPASGDSGLRTELGLIKSFHPDSDSDYATWHPWAGINAPLIGEWLRVRTGVVRTSHRTWGPFVGVTGAWEVLEGWHVGLSAGVSGNYSQGHWWRRGALPVVQWEDRENGLLWETGFMKHADTTFIGLGVHVPIALLATW